AAEAGRIVDALGAAMVAARARRGVVAVRDAAAQQALEEARAVAGATAVRVARVPDAWPQVGLDRDLGCADAWVLSGERLLDLDAAAFDRPRAPRRVTVAIAADERSAAPVARADGGS